MTTKQILLAGMRHHDFLPEIPQIYERIIGERVLLSREDDNPLDCNRAVAAYYEGNMLAYVHGDQNKDIIRQAITLTGREPYPGVVRKFRKARNEHESDLLIVDIKLPDGADLSVELKCEVDPTDWGNWQWKGYLLHRTKEQNQLAAVTDDLMWMLKDGEPWNKHYEEDIRSISANAWADISGCQQDKIRDIVAMMTMRTDDERMFEASIDLQQVMCHLGSPEVRQKVFNQLRQRAEDPKVIAKAQELGYTAEGLIADFPPGMYQLLTADPETFVGRTSYLKMPQDVLNHMFSGVTFLLCCFMEETKAKMAADLPVEQRVISVKVLLDIADQFKGMPFAIQLCQIILMSSPNLSQTDLDLIRSKMGQDPIQGQTFKECTFTGNNIIESIRNASKLPALPGGEDVKSIPLNP